MMRNMKRLMRAVAVAVTGVATVGQAHAVSGSVIGSVDILGDHQRRTPVIRRP
jgi:hypothetical protein